MQLIVPATVAQKLGFEKVFPCKPRVAKMVPEQLIYERSVPSFSQASVLKGNDATDWVAHLKSEHLSPFPTLQPMDLTSLTTSTDGPISINVWLKHIKRHELVRARRAFAPCPGTQLGGRHGLPCRYACFDGKKTKVVEPEVATSHMDL